MGAREGDTPDPFDDLVLDDEFVRAAKHTEESAAARVERLHRIDREHRRLKEQAHTDRVQEATRDKAVRRGRGRYRTVLVIGLLVALFVGTSIWRSRSNSPESATSTATSTGTVAAGGPEPGGDTGGLGTVGTLGADHPPEGVEERSEPLGAPAPVPAALGPFTYAATKPDGQPFVYSPCRPIHIVVNSRTAPPEGDILLRQALDRVTTATGLQFIIDGSTDEAPPADEQRVAYQPDRYPGRWAPVLVAWTDPAESPKLAGETLGRGGSDGYIHGSSAAYVTGLVTLDGPEFDDILRRRNGQDEARASILHELGHLVGLNHVDDPTQIMNPRGTDGVNEYGVGDLHGLARLGQGPCASGI